MISLCTGCFGLGCFGLGVSLGVGIVLWGLLDDRPK